MLRSAFTYFFLLTSFIATAQKAVPALEREVSLRSADEQVSSILGKISMQTGIKFSYSPTTISTDRKVSFTLKKKPVRTVLRIMFGEQVQYRQKGDFIILTAKAPPPVQAVREITISGYVYDENGDKLISASILNKSEHISAVTNKYGYYTMPVPANRFPVKLKIEKEHYTDTTLTIHASQTDVDVVMAVPPKKETMVPVLKAMVLTDTIIQPRAIPADTIPIETTRTTDTTALAEPSVKKKLLDNLFLSDETKANMRNIKDTLFTRVQFALVPYISTNKLLAGNTVNDVSINLLVGYSQGVNIAELGGLINIDRGDVKYFQAAGLINAVSGNVQGVQLAGTANLNSGSGVGFRVGGLVNMGNNMDGVQLAGLANVNADYRTGYSNRSLKGFTGSAVKGIQVAGLANLSAGYTEGISLAGLYNAAYNTTGIQCAGLVNGNFGYMHGVQLAGLMNATIDTSSGVHVAGLLNFNGRRSEGIHVAGLANIALGDMEGAQIAPVLNIARNMKGFQLALLNFCDSCTGVPFGLLTISAKGYHKIEVYGDEVIQTQLAFRTGVPYFHNIFTAGIDMTNRFDGLWCFGYGIGTTIGITPKWGFSADLLSQTILQKGRIEKAPQMISLFTGAERAFGKKFSIAFGPAFRLMINQNAPDNEYTDIVDKLVPYSSFSTTLDNGNTLKMWIGGKLSLKFL